MKRLLFGISAMFVLLSYSCSSDDETDDGDTLSNNPVSGMVYGTDFTVNADGGKASNITSNEIESVYIYLSSTDSDCDSSVGTEWPVTVFAPRTVGTHTENVFVSFKDPNSDDFVTVSNVTVEIISVGARVVGRVMADSSFEDSDINGRFDVPYCN